MTNYQAICFFDLDGTLLDEQSKLPEENKRALQTLQKNAILPVIASGRAPFEIKELTVGLQLKNFVSLNGQYVVVNNQEIYANAISKELIRALQVSSLERGHSLACYSKSDYRINYIEDSARALYQFDHAPLPKIEADYYLNHAIYMLYLFSEQEELDTDYRQAFPELTFFRDSPYSLAVVPNGNSKKAGMEQLLASLKLTEIPSYGFGDGLNDLPMFELVDTSIAMGNSSEVVKEQADYVTDTNINHGIIKALDRYQLL